jgi:hypothetical protein
VSRCRGSTNARPLSIDYPQFADPTPIGRVPLVGPALLLTTDGVYQGDYLEKLLTGLTGDLGVRTFADLRSGEQPPQYGWSFVVTASDLSRRRLVCTSRDLESYGVNPDEFSVPHAVHVSSVVPFAFQPVHVSGATSVDGGQLSNFPVALVDRSDGWLSSRGSGIRAAKLIVRFAGIRFLSFIGVVRDGLGRYGDRFVSTVVVGCGLLVRAVMLVSPRWPLV